MPLEIRELKIEATINEGSQGTPPPSGEATDAQNQAALIAACVEQVLSILKEKAER